MSTLDPLFIDVDDEHLAAATEGCNELSCLYHGRVNAERRRREAARSDR